jgi:hypothetical protein
MSQEPTTQNQFQQPEIAFLTIGMAGSGKSTFVSVN